MNHTSQEWHSKALSTSLNIEMFGHFGIAVLFFAPENDNPSNSINSLFIDKIEKQIEKGKIKLFNVPGLYEEIWWSDNLNHNAASKRHFEYNNFIVDEVIPLIFNQCGGPVPLVSAGVSLGAYHAANTYFRRPDIFLGTIAIDGYYDLHEFTGDYFDDNCYYNSPVHYLPNLNDNYWYSYLLSRKHVYLMSSSKEGANSGRLDHIDSILSTKKIPHHCDRWDIDDEPIDEIRSRMLEKIVAHKL